MSDMLGYERGINFTNDELRRNVNLQKDNHYKNLSDLTGYNISEKLAEGIAKEGALSSAREQAGDFLNSARNVYKTGKKLNSLYEESAGAVRGLRRGRALEGVLSEAPEGEVFGRDLGGAEDEGEEADNFVRAGGESDADINAVLDFGESLGDRIIGSSPVGQVGRAIGEGQQAVSDIGAGVQGLRDTALAGDLSGAIDNVAQIKGGFSKVGGALDSLGKAGEGLAVASGVGDVLDDIDGKFNKMNTAEKVGNVAGITGGATGLMSLAGSLETGGAMLDATGIGAELGVGLQVAGAIAGGVGAIADYIGGESKQKKQINKPAPMVPQTSQPVNQQVSALERGGVASRSY